MASHLSRGGPAKADSTFTVVFIKFQFPFSFFPKSPKRCRHGSISHLEMVSSACRITTTLKAGGLCRPGIFKPASNNIFVISQQTVSLGQSQPPPVSNFVSLSLSLSSCLFPPSQTSLSIFPGSLGCPACISVSCALH